MKKLVNPILKMDYPDPDVIRVNDTFYMVSTTMYFMPGCAILRSYDLAEWELAGYVYDKLDDTPAERLELEKTEYGGGMWAPSFRYHNGKFYIFFLSHSGNTNYLFTADRIEGPWKRSIVAGHYHDASLFFDDDDRAYLIYGNTEIRITELDEKLSGPKAGGLDRVLIKDERDVVLGYEGAHFYKIGKYYYLFVIDWPKGGMRTQNCFRGESLDGEFTGGVVLEDSRDYCGQGVAQGGIVDTLGGKWYGVFFQDMGAVGRIPVLVPMQWKDDFPVFGEDGKVPNRLELASSRPNYIYEALCEEEPEMIEKYGLAPFTMRVQSLSRTLVDKTFALCDYYMLERPQRNSRHLYDIYKLSPYMTFDDQFKRLVAEVREHRQKMDEKISPSAREDVDILAMVEKICTTDFYRSDYEDTTLKLISDDVSYETARDNYVKIARILFEE